MGILIEAIHSVMSAHLYHTIGAGEFSDEVEGAGGWLSFFVGKNLHRQIFWGYI
jgi:hypothetical protein